MRTLLLNCCLLNILFAINAQNVGIGTQTPDAKLEVSATMNEVLRLKSNNYPFISLYSGSTEKAILQHTASDDLLFWSKGSGGYLFKTSAANALYILSNGNVGIDQSVPTQKLHVEGNMRLTDQFYDGTNSPGISTQILSSTGTSTQWIDASTIGADNDWTVSGNDMYPTTATNVGIGTTSPIYKLQVQETANNQVSKDDYTLFVNSRAVTGANADSTIGSKITIEHGSGSGTAIVNSLQAYAQSNSWSGTTTLIGLHALSSYVYSGGGFSTLDNTHIGLLGEATTDSAVGTQTMIGGRFTATSGDENIALQTIDGAVQLQVLGGGGTQMVTTDNDGNLSTQAIPSGADNDWTVNGNDMYPTTATNVGLGTSTPAYTFEVQGTNTNNGTSAIYGENVPPSSYSGWGHGVYGKIESGSGYTVGVRGVANASTPNVQGRAYGVYGQASNANDGYNYGVFGRLDGGHGGAAITGWDQVSKAGWLHNTNGFWAGFFAGDVHVTDKLSINEVSPTHDLHINGDMRLEDGFFDGVNSSGTAGQILSSTGSNTQWVDASSVGSSSLCPIEPYGAAFTLTTATISTYQRIYFQRFIANSTGNYSKIRLFLDDYGSSSRTVNVAIYDRSGNVPNQLLADGSISSLTASNNDDIIEIDITDFQTGFSGTDLVAGTQYFVAVLITGGSGSYPSFWGQADVSTSNNWNKFTTSAAITSFPATYSGSLSTSGNNFWYQIAE